ncbi:MAG TPA: CoB--CoM heterodisulfide reductase iron-sulfur subunit B family protein [Desulfobacteria bacterium]|nr:CoB--CoM heterodisulfide reductase iron-sulfur subunit B family protein [Desulfobacteria bacterium]
MKYAYFPGCSLHSTGVEYDISSKIVAEKLGIELKELPDWNCCGATVGHTSGKLLGLALPGRNLAIAEKEGLDVMAPCASCYSRMKAAEVAAKTNEETRAKMVEIMEMDYQGKVGAKSALDVFIKDAGLNNVKAMVARPLNGMKVACYYGCLLVKPLETGCDDAENPMLMDNLINTLGGEAVDWPFKTECCGGSLAVPRTKIVLKLVNDILSMAEANGAEAIATACPLCMVNLDMRQQEINQHAGTNHHMPIFYFTELMAIAFGEPTAKVGAAKHFNSTAEVLAKYNLR